MAYDVFRPRVLMVALLVLAGAATSQARWSGWASPVSYQYWAPVVVPAQSVPVVAAQPAPPTTPPSATAATVITPVSNVTAAPAESAPAPAGPACPMPASGGYVQGSGPMAYSAGYAPGYDAPSYAAPSYAAPAYDGSGGYGGGSNTPRTSWDFGRFPSYGR